MIAQTDIEAVERLSEAAIRSGDTQTALEGFSLALRLRAERVSGRHVTPDENPERFSLYVLCPCILCDSTGKVKGERCGECRGEGRSRVEIATAGSPDAVGVALVTLAREGEWIDADGNPCAFGLLDRDGETGQKWLIRPWSASARNVSDAARTLAKSKTRTQSD